MEIMIAKLTPFIMIVWLHSSKEDFQIIPFQTMEACESARTKFDVGNWYHRDYTICQATGAQ